MGSGVTGEDAKWITVRLHACVHAHIRGRAYTHAYIYTRARAHSQWITVRLRFASRVVFVLWWFGVVVGVIVFCLCYGGFVLLLA